MICQKCGRPIVRDGKNWIHVDKDGKYIYESHRPVPLFP